MRVDIPVGLSTCSEPDSYAAVEEDGTSGLVIEVFDGLDKVCADVLHLWLPTKLHAKPCGRPS